jgi:hypothetical protein
MKTKKKYVEYLNETLDISNLGYLTNDTRGKHISEKSLAKKINTLGDVLRKYDSIAFEVGYNEWKSNN